MTGDGSVIRLENRGSARPCPAPTDGLEALLRAEYGPMVRLAALMTDDDDIAEELVQDAFVRLAPRLDTIANPGGYLRTIVVNLCRDYGRRRTTERRHRSSLIAEAHTLAPVELPEHPSEAWRSVAAMPADRRDVLILRFWADLATDDIAHLLQLRPATVRSHIRRGLAALRKELRHG